MSSLASPTDILHRLALRLLETGQLLRQVEAAMPNCAALAPQPLSTAPPNERLEFSTVTSRFITDFQYLDTATQHLEDSAELIKALAMALPKDLQLDTKSLAANLRLQDIKSCLFPPPAIPPETAQDGEVSWL